MKIGLPFPLSMNNRVGREKVNNSRGKKLFLILLFLYWCPLARGQEFNAFNGSVYHPMANTKGFPSSGVESDYPWVLELIEVNTSWNNNIFSYSPVKYDWKDSPQRFDDYLIQGEKKRWGTVQEDVSLFNVLFPVQLNQRRWVIGLGGRIRGKWNADHWYYNYDSTVEQFNDFLTLNAHTPQKGRVVGQQWGEGFLNVSTNILKTPYEDWNVGATLKLIKGFNAELFDLNDFRMQPNPNYPGVYQIASVTGRYGYSKNLDDLSGDNKASTNVKNFVHGTPISLELSLGATYIKKRPILIPGFKNEDPANYEWKLAFALTDFGRLKYDLGEESRVIEGPIGQPNSQYFQYYFDRVADFKSLNDSLSQILDLQPWQGRVSMGLPTALRVNFDKNLNGHFYLNAHLTLDASFLNFTSDYRLHTLNYFNLIPRWESERWGFYLPFYVNEKSKVMLGAAARLGPLRLGVHDFGWLFKHSKSGGAYFSFVITKFQKEREACFSF